jgi:hypothetical protein
MSFLANLAEEQLGDPSRFRDIADKFSIDLFAGVESSLVGLNLPLGAYKDQLLGGLRDEGGGFEQLVKGVEQLKQTVSALDAQTEEFIVNWFV